MMNFPEESTKQTINIKADVKFQCLMRACDSLSIPFLTARTEDESFSLFFSEPFKIKVQNWSGSKDKCSFVVLDVCRLVIKDGICCHVINN